MFSKYPASNVVELEWNIIWKHTQNYLMELVLLCIIVSIEMFSKILHLVWSLEWNRIPTLVFISNYTMVEFMKEYTHMETCT